MLSHPQLLGCLDFPTASVVDAPADPLRGWLIARPGAEVLGVRARIAGREFPGIHGLWRADVAAAHPQLAQAGASGFTIPVRWVPGKTVVHLDVRLASGGWTRVLERTVECRGTAAAPLGSDGIVARLVALRDDFTRRTAGMDSAALDRAARRLLAECSTAPADWNADSELCAHLDAPSGLAQAVHGKLACSGWVFPRTQAIVRVTARLGDGAASAVSHGHPRADVAAHFAREFPAAAAAQFHGLVDALGDAIALQPLSVWVELSDGTRRLALQRHVLVAPTPRGGLRPVTPEHTDEVARVFARLAFVLQLDETASQPLRPRAPSRHRPPTSVANDRGPAPRRVSPADPPADTPTRRAVIVTHNLNREGAPLIALELARHLQHTAGWSVEIISGEDGPLRDVCAAAGLAVTLAPAASVFAAHAPAELDAALAAVGRAYAWGTADLVIANSLAAFWAVPVARAAGKPALFYIHERGPAARFFGQLAPPPAPLVAAAAESAVQSATRVVFAAHATRATYAELDTAGNQQVLPSWVDAGAIAATLAPLDRAGARRRLGLAEDAFVVLTLGTVSARKGQHVLLRAAQELQRRVAARATPQFFVFLCVGARPGLFTEILERDAAHGLPAGMFRVCAETNHLAPYFAAADAVCSASFEESFPRVLLEAAVAGVPAIATDIDGVPEMFTAGREALLFPPGDCAALADTIEELVGWTATARAALAERARARVVAQFSAAVCLPRHAALATELADASR